MNGTQLPPLQGGGADFPETVTEFRETATPDFSSMVYYTIFYYLKISVN